MTTSERTFSNERQLRGQRYLEAAVRTTSPARLRLMLIERAVEVTQRLAAKWRSGEDLGVNELSMKLLDLLTELLEGVRGGATEQERRLCRQVADLYVFLTQHLLRAEQTSCPTTIDEIRMVLETEAETWRMVCVQEVSRPTAVADEPATAPSGRLNLEG